MELILKNDVENLGFKDDIVQVKNGYGRNFLIPQGHAILATPSAKKVLAENLKQRAFKEQKLVDDANALAKKITALEIKIAAKAGGTGKLFGSIGNADLSAAIKTAYMVCALKQILFFVFCLCDFEFQLYIHLTV